MYYTPIPASWIAEINARATGHIFIAFIVAIA